MGAAAAEAASAQIRNVALLGHGGSGKTTLVDAIGYIAGTTSRRGSVEEGSALTDFTPEEVEHGMSINLAVAHASWQGAKLNLLDTPGYLDFYGDVVAGVRAADAALITVDAASGVEPGTERVWRSCEERGIPRMLFVSRMDTENASFDRAFRQIQEVLSDGAIPVEVPVGDGSDFRGIVNLFSERAHVYRPDGDRGEYDEQEVPEELADLEEEWHTELVETVATTDDALLEAYLEGEELDRERVLEAMKAAMLRGEIFPVFCGSAEKAWGVRAIMNKMVELFPSPAEAGSVAAETSSGEAVELEAADGGSVAALVFKTTSEPHTGELSYVRLFSGSIRDGDSLRNPTRSVTERVSHLSVPAGEERREVGVLHAGDIGVLAKLKDTHTGDTLASGDRPVILDGVDWPDPDVAEAVRASSRGEEDKLATGLSKLHEEDPTFVAEYDPELEQTIARGLGELHLTVSLEKLERKYGVRVDREPPKIPYRETFTRRAEGRARHKKQTGGRGQFGECWIRIEPLPRGSGYEFVDSIKGGVIPSKFVPAVDEGIREAAAGGIVAGYPVVDFRAEVYDGSHHSVDSSEQAFKVAGSKAFKQVAREAGPVLLEPVLEVEVTTPEEYMGDVIGDLNGRRGRVLGVEPRGHLQVVKAHVPQPEMYRYSATLRSITHGTGDHTRDLHGYEKAPDDVAERVAAEAEREG
jgi:elongation factor G